MKTAMGCGKAPITAAQRAQLARDARDLYGAAKRKGCTLDVWDHAREAPAAREHFELGCWLYYFVRLDYANKATLNLRIDIVRRLFEAGLHSPGYMFYTVFDFGERQFDGVFEQGDAEQVIEGLRAFLCNDKVRKGFEYFGWSLEGAQVALF
ncbi:MULTISPECIES: hypothetical protein [Pandoraea]|nr:MULTISPECIES: hypothetical protein [Pandoraea]